MVFSHFPKEPFMNEQTLHMTVPRNLARMQSLIPEFHTYSTRSPEVEYSLVKQGTSHYSTQAKNQRFDFPCPKSRVQDDTPSHHHLTDFQPITVNTFALVFSVKTFLVNLKFTFSANSHWRYFNNPHCIEREAF